MKLSTSKMQWLYLGFFLLIVWSLNGCASNPSEADARKAFEDKWEDELKGGVIRINSFKKVNAESGELLGVKFYRIEYDAEVEYLKDVVFGKMEFVVTKKGTIKKLEGEKMTFVKTEKGWKIRQI